MTSGGHIFQLYGGETTSSSKNPFTDNVVQFQMHNRKQFFDF